VFSGYRLFSGYTFVVLVMLFSMLNVLYFYISTFQSMCADDDDDDDDDNNNNNNNNNNNKFLLLLMPPSLYFP
jgi:hypothetical protein